MRLDPARLIVLHTVARAGSVQAAARQLHLVPSGVSQHLAALERETGLALVDRTRRGGSRPLVLTAAGRRLAEHAERLVSVLHRAERDLSSYLGEIHGTVRLSVFPSALAGVVLPALSAVATSYPGIRAVLSAIEGDPATTALHNDELDLLLAETGPDDPPAPAGLTRRTLLHDPYLVAVPAEWPPPQSLADLAETAWVGAPPGSTTARTLQRLRRDNGLSLTEAHLALEFPAVLDLVGAGFGAALIPRLAVPDDYHGPARLVKLPALGGRAITVLHSTSRPVRSAVSTVLDALEAAAKDCGGQQPIVLGRV